MPNERVRANSETVSVTQDPIIPLYQEWCRARRDWLAMADKPGNEDWDHPESKAAEARWDAAFDAMLKLTPASLPGIAAFAHVLWSLVGPSSAEDTPDFEEECELPECKLLAGIWRGAGGASPIPLG
jgi:hypothetical protein